jgi:hypothetical protein
LLSFFKVLIYESKSMRQAIGYKLLNAEGADLVVEGAE